MRNRCEAISVSKAKTWTKSKGDKRPKPPPLKDLVKSSDS